MSEINPEYWAVVLDVDSRDRLLERVKPKHSRVYADHMTIVYGPTAKQNDSLFRRLGNKVELNVMGHSWDEKGEAVVVSGEDRLGFGVAHITISCAGSIQPVYSNTLLQNGWELVENFTVSGRISAYHNYKWI